MNNGKGLYTVVYFTYFVHFSRRNDDEDKRQILIRFAIPFTYLYSTNVFSIYFTLMKSQYTTQLCSLSDAFNTGIP